MAQPAVDAEALVARLWEEVKARNASDRAFTAVELSSRERLQHLWELRYLNHHWDFPFPSAKDVAGSGWRSRVKGRLAQFVLHLLHPYFVNQQEYNAHIVRVDNEYARSIDALVDDVRAVAEALHEEVQRLSDRDHTLHSLLEERVARLERLVGNEAPTQ